MLALKPSPDCSTLPCTCTAPGNCHAPLLLLVTAPGHSWSLSSARPACARFRVVGLEEEMWRQGDREREMGLPISPLADRTKQGVSKAQLGFYEFIALPLVHNFSHVFPECKHGPLAQLRR